MLGQEQAVELTIKAMELGCIKFANWLGTDESMEKSNAFNAKQIMDFYYALARDSR